MQARTLEHMTLEAMSGAVAEVFGGFSTTGLRNI
jgi:hypothetical protein